MTHHSLTLLVVLCGLSTVSGQSFCCIQPEFTGNNLCTTVEYCNQSQLNCEGDCEGLWSIPGNDSPLCISQGQTCSPTNPVQCCEPYSCIDAVNNIGVCGTAILTPAPVPTFPTSPMAAPVAPTPPSGIPATFYFGHSLIYHTFTDYPNVNVLGVPYWMNQFENGWSADGEFRTANYDLPAYSQWGFIPDLSAWNGSFQASNYDSVVYTELNFVQYNAPSVPYDYNDPHAATPIDSVVRILDYIGDDSVPLYIYECWNGAESFMPDYYPFLGSNIIPTTAQRDAYYASTGFDSAYHQWWLDLYYGVLHERPGANVELIMVSPILVAVLSDVLGQVPFDALFEDNAPHGKPSVYFLSALIQYMAVTGQPPRAEYQPPTDGTLVPQILQDYDAIVDLITSRLNEAPTVPSTPVTTVPNPQTPAPVPSPTPSPTPGGGSDPCCVQEEINGLDACTTVDYCNQQQSHCEGPCEGVWTVLSGNPPVAPVSPPVPEDTPAPSPPRGPSSVGGACCIQEEINGPDACTTIPYCNEQQSHCEGPCEGVWTTDFWS